MERYNLSKNIDNCDRSTEVEPRAKRRAFTASYKRKILARAAECKKRGELGALLRREGLRASTLQGWRMAEANGRLRGSKDCKRGSHPSLAELEKQRLRSMEKEILSLQKRAERAEALLELQKKIADFMSMSPVEDRGRKS